MRLKSKPSSQLVSTVEEELEKALQAVAMTKFRTEQLHENWRRHLFRMSVGAVLLSMHQYSQPLRECILEMKSSQLETQVETFFVLEKLFMVGLVELMNLIIAILLFRFTGMDKPGDFSSRPYITAAVLVPICISLFFTTERCGCAIESTGSSRGGTEHDSSSFPKTDRQFPVAVIYHLIVTLCYWFMKVGMDSCEANLEEVTKMKKQLKKNSQKKRK